MAHREQIEFVKSLKAQFPRRFARVNVLEFGSRNVNGTVRDLFSGCFYCGVDAVSGPGVDYVCEAAQFPDDWPEVFGRDWQTVFSCEMLEHDPNWRQSVSVMVRAVAPGGMFFGTAAGPARPEHGTPRTSKVGEHFYGPRPDYYGNICPVELSLLLWSLARWSVFFVLQARGGQDVQWYGIKEL